MKHRWGWVKIICTLYWHEWGLNPYTAERRDVKPNTSRTNTVYGHSLIFNTSLGMYQEIHPGRVISIDSIRINTSLLLNEERVSFSNWVRLWGLMIFIKRKLPHPQGGRHKGEKACPRRGRSRSRRPLCTMWSWVASEVGGPPTHCSGPPTALTGAQEALTGPRLRPSPGNFVLPFCAGGQMHAWRPGRRGRPRQGMLAPQSNVALRASHHKMFLSSAICPYPLWCW